MEWKYKEDRITYEDQGKVLAEVFFPEEGEFFENPLAFPRGIV